MWAFCAPTFIPSYQMSSYCVSGYCHKLIKVSNVFNYKLLYLAGHQVTMSSVCVRESLWLDRAQVQKAVFFNINPSRPDWFHSNCLSSFHLNCVPSNFFDSLPCTQPCELIKQYLAGIKLPKTFIFVDEIPYFAQYA